MLRNRIQLTLAAVLLSGMFSALANAQISAPLYTKTYYVEVEYEMWRNGNRYWATEFETSDQQDAQLMYDLLVFAWENGAIRDLLDVGFDWMVVDIRLRTKTEWHLLTEPIETSRLRPVWDRD